MKLTKLALALMGVLAMAAMTASAASAHYTSSSSPVMLFGTQTPGAEHVFHVDDSNVECEVATFEKASLTTTPTANEVPGVKASYSECNAFGIGAVVNMGTCTYNFDTPNASLVANVDVVCNNNANVNGTGTNNGDARIFASIVGQTCEVHVESQNNRSHVSFFNNKPNAGKVRVVATVGGITAEKTVDNGLCPLNGLGTVNNSTYNGNTDVEGTSGITIQVD